VKLCRFEKVDDPGVARSGFAYEGRIIETDGTQAIETYLGSDVRLLAPIGRPNTIRLFRHGQLGFEYLNPLAMFGPNQAILKQDPEARFGYLPCLAAILIGKGVRVPVSQADDLIMGLTFAHVFRHIGKEGAAAADAGFAIGPAIVTPDEFEGGSIRPETGAVYADEVTMLQNSVEVARFEIDGLRPTMAQAIATASETQVVGEGDIIVLPLGDPEIEAETGDELRITSERIGTLIVRIG
jgi:2-keto-4-pentenoate hydratase/2-oxohepta-3-ene-1,7-dioic acid hydratase in catechol pathway